MRDFGVEGFSFGGLGFRALGVCFGFGGCPEGLPSFRLCQSMGSDEAVSVDTLATQHDAGGHPEL